MTFLKLALLTTINCLIASTAFGAQAPQEEQDEAWVTTKHEVGPQTLLGLKETTKSLEKTADTLKQATQNINIGIAPETTQSLEKTAHTLKQAAQNATVKIGISTENSIRFVGLASCCAGLARISNTGGPDLASIGLITSGAGLLFGARNIGSIVDQGQSEN